MLGLVNVAVSVLGDSHDPHGNNPWQLLTTDRAVTLVRMSTTTLVMALAFAFWRGLNGTGILDCLVLGLRLWLPLTGRLPWRPKRFLEDAHERGVLRQAGAAYQFRHSQLRDHLAAHHRTSRKSRSTSATAR